MAPLILMLAMDVTVRLHSIQGGGATVKMPLEQYVAAVLAGEAAGMSSPEAQKAMAIAARTYAVRNRGRHKKEGFDFCDTTHCQDFRRTAVNAAVTRAAAETEGEMLWRHGSLVEALYSKNCGGYTAGGLRDPWCPKDEWQRTISTADLGGAVEIVGRGPGGRVTQLRLAGRTMPGDDFHLLVGRNLGWDRLPSTWFDVQPAGDRVVFQGRGHGHGLGLCQLGCARMGEAGKSYRNILAAYFPAAVVGTSASGITWRSFGGERVEIFSSAADEALVPVAERALAEAEERTGLRAAGPPRLWFYPTVAAFRDATGQPGDVAATTSDLTIRLQPASVLRSKGALVRTVRHELLHAVLESNSTAPHAWWFREGLVLCLNREAPTDPRYRDAAQRVSRLLAVHGEGTVLGWWKTGLPREAAPGGVQQ